MKLFARHSMVVWAGVLLAHMWAGVVLAAPTSAPSEIRGVGEAVAGSATSAASGADGITLHVPSVIKAGQEIDAEATLVIGRLLQPDSDLHFLVDDIERRVERTDAQGTAYFRLRGVLASGSHQLMVMYDGGSRSLAALSASSTFVVAPLILKVQTVPTMLGITLALDGENASVSDATGEAVLGVARAGIHILEVRIPAPGPNTRFSFSRWSDDNWTPSRPIRIVDDASISVGLRVAYLTQLQFVDLDRHPLDHTRVSHVVISGPNAELKELQYPFEPIWLQTPIPAKHTGENGLHITFAPYSLSFAKYDGLNVASGGQMRYSPAAGGTWSIPLLLFTLRLGASDAMFGTPLHEPIRLIGPSGHAQIVKLDRNGAATLVVARGNYTAQVQVAGMAPVATIALSRSQHVTVPVITPLDISILAAACLVVMAAVFAAGRGRRLVFSLIPAGRLPRVSRRRIRLTLGGATLFPLSSRARSLAAAPAKPQTSPAQPGARATIDGSEEVPSVQPSFASQVVAAFPQSYLLTGSPAAGERSVVGAILSGLIDSGKAERFLLLVHPSTMRDWQRALNDQFFLSIPRLERGSFYDPDDRKRAWSGNPWRAFPLVVASSSLARRRGRREELLAAGPWDVVVIDGADEAHRAGGRSTGTPNKLLALLQAMKANHSWKAVYLASSNSPRVQRPDVGDLIDLLGSSHMSDHAGELARDPAIPLAERDE